MKNSFGVILGLINFKIDSAGNDCSRNALSDIATRIQVLADLYSLLYRSGDGSAVPLDRYIERIAESVRMITSRVSIQLHLEDLVVAAKTASVLGLIIVELLTNCLKYAFPDNRSGTVTINLRGDADKLEISVCDDGIGLPENFSTDSGTGLGMQIVEAMIRQIQGEMRILPGSGAGFVITAPLV